MATVRRPMSWVPLMSATIIGAVAAGIVLWQWSLKDLDRQTQETRAELKKLSVSGGLSPTQEVMDYLSARQVSLEERYRYWLEVAAVPPVAEAAGPDPQLYFQEQFHDMQRTLERLTAARSMPVPEQLGFPKELPPSDTVPRLLVQVSLIQESAALILQHGVKSLTSFKVEDPETVSDEEQPGAFLLRLPVRIRVTCSLAQLMKVLGALERIKPVIDVRAVRILGGSETDTLDAELVLARYLATAAVHELTTPSDEARPPTKKSSTRPLPADEAHQEERRAPRSSAR